MLLQLIRGKLKVNGNIKLLAKLMDELLRKHLLQTAQSWEILLDLRKDFSGTQMEEYYDFLHRFLRDNEEYALKNAQGIHEFFMAHSTERFSKPSILMV